jgi:hypothetical protein
VYVTKLALVTIGLLAAAAVAVSWYASAVPRARLLASLLPLSLLSGAVLALLPSE